jgi:hypothetical protein
MSETIQLSINVPTNWSAITLKKYLEFQRDLKVYGEEEVGYMACVLHHLCGIDASFISKLPTDIYTNIKNDMIEFIGKTDLPLQRIIKIDGVEYGFEPNLSKIPYGAYLDITKYDTLTIDDNWVKIMAILYRPIKSKSGALYTIEGYKGVMGEEKFLNIGMDVHFGALQFFFLLSEDLVKDILKSLKVEKLPPNIKSILEENGKAMEVLYNWQEMIS